MLSDDFRPYLIRAFYDYAGDLGLTPYIHVFVNDATHVPLEYVKDQAITLNISAASTPNIQLKKTEIIFSARFAGQIREIIIPIGQVLAIYAKERPDLILTFPLVKSAKTKTTAENGSPDPVLMQKAKKPAAPASFLKVVKKTSD